MRGFEKVSLKISDPYVVIPSRSTKGSAGYDFVSPVNIEISPKESFFVKTGIKAYMLMDECLFIYPRSSIGIKHGIMLKNTIGVVDSDYYNNEDNEGEIIVSLYNYSDKIFSLKKGERFCQGIFQKVLFSESETGQINSRKGGIGSTGN